jgi:hypothetical protein
VIEDARPRDGVVPIVALLQVGLSVAVERAHVLGREHVRAVVPELDEAH